MELYIFVTVFIN